MHLSYTGDNNSFLAYNAHWGRCIIPLLYAVPDVTAQKCSVHSIQQHWIWTKYNQLLNLNALKCIQTSEIRVPIILSFAKYPKVSLTSCNASDPKQIWQCLPGKEDLVYLAYEKGYLNYGNERKDPNAYRVIVYSGSSLYSRWKRYQSQGPLCSTASTYHGKSNRPYYS